MEVLARVQVTVEVTRKGYSAKHTVQEIIEQAEKESVQRVKNAFAKVSDVEVIGNPKALVFIAKETK
jgi:hypothetical protein